MNFYIKNMDYKLPILVVGNQLVELLKTSIFIKK